jgi:hypothetical protein
MIFGACHAAQDRPDDGGVIAAGKANTGVAVDQLGRLGDN